MDQTCLEEIDLTPPQLVTLKIISCTDNCIMSDLSKNLGVTMGNMTSMVDRLIKGGYVAREHDSDDRRVVKVKLTSKGKEITAKANKRKKSILQKVLNKLSKKDIETMLDLFDKIISNQELKHE